MNPELSHHPAPVAWRRIRSVIEENVAALGGNIRMRGVKITGGLTTTANGFSAAFRDVGGTIETRVCAFKNASFTSTMARLTSHVPEVRSQSLAL